MTIARKRNLQKLILVINEYRFFAKARIRAEYSAKNIDELFGNIEVSLKVHTLYAV